VLHAQLSKSPGGRKLGWTVESIQSGVLHAQSSKSPGGRKLGWTVESIQSGVLHALLLSSKDRLIHIFPSMGEKSEFLPCVWETPVNGGFGNETNTHA